MLNLSQIAREERGIPLKERMTALFHPEIYRAKSIADYKENKHNIRCRPLKKNPLSNANYYAFIIFYNIEIGGIIEENKPIPEIAEIKIHDDTGSELIFWGSEGKIWPAEKSYSEMMLCGELKNSDRVHRLIAKHIYEDRILFVSEITKNYEIRRRKESPLIERISSSLQKLIAEMA